MTIQKKILTGVGSLFMKRQAYISFSSRHMQDAKRYILYTFFFQLSGTEAAQSGKYLAFAHSSLPVYKQQPQGTRLFHECCKQEQRWERKKNPKCTNMTDICMLEGGKRCFVSISLHLYHHTNTKSKQNNAVYLGFHKLRSGTS